MDLEREIKLRAPQDFSLARAPRAFDGYLAGPPHVKRLHTFYYDSDDLRLQRWGCSFRYRQGEGWTLKIPVPTTGTAVSREEHVFEGGAEQIPQDALDLSAAYLRGAALQRVAELRTVRVEREIRDGSGKTIAEAVEDDVRVIEGFRVKKRFRQIEIELENGADPSVLNAIASAFRHQGAGGEYATPKDVAALSEAGLAPEIEIPKLDANSQTIDLIRSSLAQSVTRLIRIDAKLRTSDDAEAVHRSRVAVRRLRSNLRTFGPLLDSQWANGLRDRLKWFQDLLSPVRDADVLLDFLGKLAERLPFADVESTGPLFQMLRTERGNSYRQLCDALHSKVYIDLLNDLVRAAQRPRMVSAPDKRAHKIMEPLMRGAWKRARKAVRKAGRVPSDRALHGIRIKSKHLRYASEAFVCIGGNAAKKYAESVEAVQTILGDQHDGVVAVKRLREMAVSEDVGFVAGELATLAHDAQCEARARWKKAWRKVRRKGAQFWR